MNKQTPVLLAALLGSSLSLHAQTDTQDQELTRQERNQQLAEQYEQQQAEQQQPESDDQQGEQAPPSNSQRGNNEQANSEEGKNEQSSTEETNAEETNSNDNEADTTENAEQQDTEPTPIPDLPHIQTLAEDSHIAPNLRNRSSYNLMMGANRHSTAAALNGTPYGEIATDASRSDIPFPVADIDSQIVPAPTIYNRAARATYFMMSFRPRSEGDGWRGAGFATAVGVSEDGHFLTNAHVFDNVNDDTVTLLIDIDGYFWPVEQVLAVNSGDDVALAKVKLANPERTFHHLPIATRNAPAGTSIYCMSHPANNGWLLTQGMINGYQERQRSRNDNNPPQRMLIDADYARGSSGGAILDQHGRIVGLVSSTNSIYYRPHQGEVHPRTNALQMVLHHCVSQNSIEKLFQSDDNEPDQNSDSE